MLYHLLTEGRGSPKIVHGDLEKYEAAILHLLPHKEGRFKSSVCPWSTPGCRATCLNYAGRGGVNKVYGARYWKSKLWRESRALFLQALTADLSKLSERAAKRGKKAVCRLDGTSDIGLAAWMAPLFPMILFYDYTKSSLRYANWLVARKSREHNIHMTFSRSEENWEDCAWFLKAKNKGNVAVVFNIHRSQPMIRRWKGFDVVDGDTHDFRFLDPDGVVVGLRAKGRARHDTSGFVVHVAK